MIKKIKDHYKEHILEHQFSEKGFLKYYFQEVSDQEGQPLEYFADPIKTKNSSFKSINKSYLSLIFKSKWFTEELWRQMSFENILSEYQKYISRKVE